MTVFNPKLLDRRKVFDFTEEEIMWLAMRDWEYADQHWNKYFDKFRRWDKCYNLNDPIDYSGAEVAGSAEQSQNLRANNFYPLVQVMCDTIHAIISDSLFPQDEFFHMRPTEAYDNEYLREAGKDFLMFDLKPERTDFRKHWDNHLHQAIRYDWSIMRVGYRCAGRNVMVSTKTIGEKIADNVRDIANKVLEKLNQEALKGKYRPAFKIEYKADADQSPDMELVNTYNSRPDPKALDFDDKCRFFTYEIEVPWFHLYANQKDDKNKLGLYDQSAITAMENEFRASQAPGQQEITEGEVQKGVSAPQLTDDIVKLRVWANQYAEFVFDQNYKSILRRRKKDGWDYNKLVYAPRLHRWEGYAVPARCEKLNYELNAIANSRRDNVNMIVDAIMVINKNMFSTEWTDTKQYSGKPFIVDGSVKDAIDFIRPPDGTQAATQEIAFVQSWAEKSLGPGENAQGQYRSSDGRTATESEIIANALSQRMTPITERIERDNLRWTLKKIMQAEQLYSTDETIFTVVGPEGTSLRRMTPEILSLFGPDIDITPIGTTVEQNRFYNRLEKLETIKIIGSVQQAAELLNWPKAIRQILESSRFQGIDDLIINDPTKTQTIPPEYENMILVQEPIAIRDADNHDEHIQVHREFMASDEFQELPQSIKHVFEVHVKLHEDAVAQKQQTHPGPTRTPDVFQGSNIQNQLSANNPMSQSGTNMPEQMGVGA